MRWLLSILLLFQCTLGFAQTVGTSGKVFYASFNWVATAYDNTVSANIFVTSKYNTSGRVSNPNTGFTKSFTINAGQITLIDIPVNEIVNDSADRVVNKGVIVEALDTITAFGLAGSSFNSDAATLLPVESLGTEYRIASYYSPGSNLRSCFTIIATEDNTEITIIPADSLSGNQPAGQPFKIILNKAQVYYVRNARLSPKRDLSQSRVFVEDKCKPIAVFSGSEGPYVPANYGAADLLMEQLFPLSTFGKAFITPALRGRNIYRARVYAAYDNTEVEIGKLVKKTINANEYVEFQAGASLAVLVTTSKPSQVAIFAVGQDYDKLYGPANEGDPTMMLVPPLEQNLKKSIFLSPTIGVIQTHRLCIITKSAGAAQTTLDGKNIGASFSPLTEEPSYSFATLDVKAGQHTIENAAGFLAYSYGFGHYQGYGYSTGANAERIETYFDLNGTTSISRDTADACINDAHFRISAAVPDSAYTWDFGDGSPLVRTDGSKLDQQHVYKTPGYYTVTMTKYLFDAGACNVNGFSTTLPVHVVSITSPTLNITAVPSAPVCPGVETTFIATGTGGGTQPIYQWKVNGTNVGTNSSTFTTKSLKAGDVISCTYTSSLACTTTPEASASLSANIAPDAAPTITVLASTDSLCSPAPVTFDARLMGGFTYTGFQWQVNGTDVGKNSSRLIYTPANGDEIVCIVTAITKCGDTVKIPGNKIKMVVNTIPQPAIAISTATNTFCSGTNVILNANLTNGGPNPVITWLVNDVVAGTNSSTFTSSTFRTGDVVRATLTTSGTCASSTPSNTINLVVNPILTPSISIASPRLNVCAGDNIDLKATIQNGGPGAVLSWQVNGINVAANQNNFSSSQLKDGDVITAMLVANNVCQTLSKVTSNQLVASVTPVRSPQVTINVSKNPICDGERVEFTANANDNSQDFSYQWNLNGKDLPGETNQLLTRDNFKDGDKIICKIIPKVPCMNGAVSNEIRMTVHPVFTPSLSIASPRLNVCAGDNIDFKATFQNGGPGGILNWQVNGINMAGNQSNFSSSQLKDGDVITAILVANNVCQTLSKVTSNQLVVSVKPIRSPQVAITASKNPICDGEPVEFTARATDNSQDFSYQWNINGKDLPGETNQRFARNNFKDGDKAICKIIPKVPCMNGAVSNEITMTVYPMPTVVFNPDTTLIYRGTSFTMSPIITGDIAQYRWTPLSWLSNTNTPTPIATPQQKTDYKLEVETAFGCKASATFQVQVFDKVSMPTAFTPNGDGKNDVFRIPPFYQQIRLNHFAVFNRWGEKIFETNDVAKGWDGTYKGSKQPSGNYVWVMDYDNPLTKKTEHLNGSVVLIR